MSRKTITWLIIAASLLLIGCILFGGMMTMLNWDFRKLSTDKYETNEYPLREDYDHISVITDTADLVFVPSENGKGSVTCYENEHAKHSVSVKDGTLVIEVRDTRKWYEHIGIHFGTPKITVSIPQGDYGMLSVKASTGDLEIPDAFAFESMDIEQSTGHVTNGASASGSIRIKTSTGKIHVENLSAGTLELTVSTGKVTASGITCRGDVTVNVSTGKADLTDIRCKNVISGGSTGNLSMKNVIATEAFSIQRSTGDVKLEGCDAAALSVQTSTGDVTGHLLTEKIFMTQTSTGKVNVPQTVTGGKCEIITGTGDIRITVD